MTTLSNRIDSVATHILTAKQDLRQAILDKKGTVRENPTFEELKNGIEGISTGTIINYDSYYPEFKNITQLKNRDYYDSNLNFASNSHIFYRKEDNSLYFASRSASNLWFHCYTISTKTITNLKSIPSTNTYSDKNVVNLIPYDTNNETSFKFYYCIGNLYGKAENSSLGVVGQSGLYSFDFVAKTYSTLYRYFSNNCCLFNYSEDLSSLYALLVSYSRYLIKVRKDTFTQSTLSSYQTDSSFKTLDEATCLVNPYQTQKIYYHIGATTTDDYPFSGDGYFTLSTNTHTLLSFTGSTFVQIPIPILQKEKTWGSIGYSVGYYDNLEQKNESFEVMTILGDKIHQNSINPIILVPIWGFPFFYDLSNHKEYEGGYFKLPISDLLICECCFNQNIFEVKRENDKDIYLLLENINRIINPNTVFRTQIGYEYLICESPITGYIKYI